MDDKHLEIYASLMAKVALSEAAIRANPLPHINAAGKEIVRLRDIIERASLALSGMDDFDLMVSADVPIERMDITRTDTMRRKRALEILSELRTPPPTDTGKEK